MSKVIEATHAELFLLQGYAVVEFWAPWCGPCKRMAPVLDEVSEEVSDVKIVKVNVDENPESATAFGIMSVPTFLFTQDGIVRQQVSGPMDKEKLLERISALKEQV